MRSHYSSLKEHYPAQAAPGGTDFQVRFTFDDRALTTLKKIITTEGAARHDSGRAGGTGGHPKIGDDLMNASTALMNAVDGRISNRLPSS